MAFLNEGKIKNFQDIIKNNIKKYKKLNKFQNYLENYLFKLNTNTYNYENIIKEKYEEGNSKPLEKLYLTNNICESINSKINLYLPKKVTSNVDFVECLTKIFINNKFDNKDIIRHDYISRPLIKIIKDKDLNENLQWIKYDEFIRVQKYIINGMEDDLEEDDINKLISLLNNISIKDKDDSFSEGKCNNSLNSEDIIEENEEQNNESNISYSEEDISFNQITEQNINDNYMNNSDNSFKDILSEEDSNNNIDFYIETLNMDKSNDKNDSFYKLSFKERLKIRLKENYKNKKIPKIKPIKRSLFFSDD